MLFYIITILNIFSLPKSNLLSFINIGWLNVLLSYKMHIVSIMSTDVVFSSNFIKYLNCFIDSLTNRFCKVKFVLTKVPFKLVH